MKNQTPNADITWIDRPEVFRVNQIKAHSDHTFYQTKEAFQNGVNSFCQKLNGMWKFHYSENSMERPVHFYETDFDSSTFDEIKVPQHIELAGYDKIHYINTMYPWEGHEYRRPAGTTDSDDGSGMFSKAKYNPVGSYLCYFDLDEALRNQKVRISFEGVEQAMYVWLNGNFVGYAEDSFTVSEFDLSPFICNHGNILAVEVHKRSTAAFLEDQDFFRFFGIFRNVCLYAIPQVHLEDLWIRPEWDINTGHGCVNVDFRLNENEEKHPGGYGIVSIYDEKKLCTQEKIALSVYTKWTCTIPDTVTPWCNENPYLYRLEVEVYDESGNLQEFIPYSFGFRKIELKDRIMYFNGERLILHGVNRHEWSASGGRCICDTDEKYDIDCLKRNNINAVRTCHYPDRISWYHRCDKAGIYVMAETNLESHGSWQKMGAIEPSWNVPGSIPIWREATLDRARTNFEMFKNHVSVLFWSLGNESYAGDILAEMNRFYKETDQSRLVHYEGVYNNRNYEDVISDMESQMYAPPKRIEAYLNNSPKKPFILCEYMHDMGNSLGGLSSYMELIKKYEMFQGGFIWDYIDQALFVTDEVTGEKVLRYGGDFDDRPSDYEFSGDGLLFADRTEKPAMQEVRYWYGK